MADNVPINPGTTTPIATDDVAGVQFQKIKVNLGADGVDGSLWNGNVNVTSGTVKAIGQYTVGETFVDSPQGMMLLWGSNAGADASMVELSSALPVQVTINSDIVSAINPFPVSITAGTVALGEVGTVKINPTPVKSILSFGTVFGGTEATYGTLVNASSIGTGNSLWLTSFKVGVDGTGSLRTMLGFGTNLEGTTVVDTGVYAGLTNISREFILPVNCGISNTSLLFYIGAAGTVSVDIKYFVDSNA